MSDIYYVESIQLYIKGPSDLLKVEALASEVAENLPEAAEAAAASGGLDAAGEAPGGFSVGDGEWMGGFWNR